MVLSSSEQVAVDAVDPVDDTDSLKPEIREGIMQAAVLDVTVREDDRPSELHLDDLPNELLVRILKYLSTIQRQRVSRVSSHFYNLCNSEELRRVVITDLPRFFEAFASHQFIHSERFVDHVSSEVTASCKHLVLHWLYAESESAPEPGYSLTCLGTDFPDLELRIRHLFKDFDLSLPSLHACLKSSETSLARLTVVRTTTGTIVHTCGLLRGLNLQEATSIVCLDQCLFCTHVKSRWLSFISLWWSFGFKSLLVQLERGDDGAAWNDLQRYIRNVRSIAREDPV